MTRTLAAVFVMGALLSLPLTSFALPSLNDTSYSAYCKGPCDTCVTGERAAKSVTMWVTSPTVTERWPQNPWLTVRVNGRDTALGKEAVVLDGQLMLPVMAAEEFGLTATRSGLNHRFLQLSGGRYPVKLTIGTRQAEVGYALRSLPVAPKWHNGKVYMPFETIAGYLDWTLTFDGPSGVLAVQTRGSDLTSYMNTATWAHSRGLYDEAVEQWQKAIALEDDDWYLYQRLGDALAGAGRIDEALAAYDQALSLAPLTAPALRTQAARYQNAGDPAKAIEAYRKALAIDPNYIESRIELGQALINSGDLAGAEQEARRAIALAPDNPFAHNVLGYALRKQGKDDDAALSYLKAIELAPNYALAYNNLGVALLSLGRSGDAESMLSRAVALAPSRSDFQANLGRALLDNGKLNPAIDAWVAAVKLAPDVTEYRAGLAAVLLKHGSVEGALRESNAALANYDANLANLNTLQARGAAGNEAMQSEALSLLDAARLRATCVKAWALLEKGRAAEARRVADDALALDGKDIAAQAVMAAVLVETLDADAAAAAVAGPVGVTPPPMPWPDRRRARRSSSPSPPRSWRPEPVAGPGTSWAGRTPPWVSRPRRWRCSPSRSPTATTPTAVPRSPISSPDTAMTPRASARCRWPLLPLRTTRLPLSLRRRPQSSRRPRPLWPPGLAGHWVTWKSPPRPQAPGAPPSSW
jgi:Flp pilus assembly protein TadD